MALVEVEDQYLDQLRALQSQGVPLVDRTADYRKAKEHETFITQVGNNPKHREKLMRLIADTGVYVPEVARVDEARAELTGIIDERMKPLNEFLESQKAREAEQKTKSVENLIEGGRTYLRKEGWDDDGVKEVETFMQQNSIGSYEVASKYLKSQKPSPDPLPTTSWNGNDLGSAWFHQTDDAPDHKLLLDNPQAFTQREIAKFMREKREGRLNI